MFGELDLSTTAPVEHQVLSALDQADNRRVVDLRGLVFMNSVGSACSRR